VYGLASRNVNCWDNSLFHCPKELDHYTICRLPRQALAEYMQTTEEISDVDEMVTLALFD